MRFLKKIQEFSEKVAIFGTSISATWLTGSLAEQVMYFLDEDIRRIGRTHLKRLIYDTQSAPVDLPICLPFAYETASIIAKRLAIANLQYILPPME